MPVANNKSLAEPPHRQHSVTGTWRPGSVGAAAEEVVLAGEDLLEETTLLERFADDDLHHVAMTCVRDLRQARTPPGDECVVLSDIVPNEWKEIRLGSNPGGCDLGLVDGLGGHSGFGQRRTGQAEQHELATALLAWAATAADLPALEGAIAAARARLADRLEYGSDALAVRDRWVVANWAPALETWRMTFTYPVLDAARSVLFVVTGRDKAGALRRVREGGSDLPAARVQADRTVWLVDAAAAGGAPSDR